MRGWLSASGDYWRFKGIWFWADSEDLIISDTKQIISDTKPGTIGPSGPLPSAEWISGVHQELEHSSGLWLVTKSEPVHVSACTEIMPHTCDFIFGEWQLSALSKEVTGTQKNHKLCMLLSRTMCQCGWGTLREISVAAIHSSKLISSFLHTLVRKNANVSVFHLSSTIIHVTCTTPSPKTITTESPLS